MVTTLSQKRLDELDCVLGLDCSRYQANIDWSKAYAAGIRFAYIKITEGETGHEDSIYNLKARVLSAQQNKIKVGYYHFARPGDREDPEIDALNEATNVTDHIAFLPAAEFPVVLDLEAYSSSVVWDNKVGNMDRFVKEFNDQLGVYFHKVMFYSNKSFADLNTDHLFGSMPLWIAAYPNNPEIQQPSIPVGWDHWDVWQFTEKGQIDGYNGDIDLNIMKKDFFKQF